MLLGTVLTTATIEIGKCNAIHIKAFILILRSENGNNIKE